MHKGDHYGEDRYLDFLIGNCPTCQIDSYYDHLHPCSMSDEPLALAKKTKISQQ